MDLSLLARLPGELRQQIWDLALIPKEGVKIDISGTGRKTQLPLAITQVCRQIRQECRSEDEFWRRNDFVIFVGDLVADLNNPSTGSLAALRPYWHPVRPRLETAMSALRKSSHQRTSISHCTSARGTCAKSTY